MPENGSQTPKDIARWLREGLRLRPRYERELALAWRRVRQLQTILNGLPKPEEVVKPTAPGRVATAQPTPVGPARVAQRSANNGLTNKVRQVLRESPGLRAAEIHERVSAAIPTSKMSIFSTIQEIKHELRVEGSRGKYRYFLRAPATERQNEASTATG